MSLLGNNNREEGESPMSEPSVKALFENLSKYSPSKRDLQIACDLRAGKVAVWQERREWPGRVVYIAAHIEDGMIKYHKFVHNRTTLDIEDEHGRWVGKASTRRVMAWIRAEVLDASPNANDE
jgi:hypothetical protein